MTADAAPTLSVQVVAGAMERRCRSVKSERLVDTRAAAPASCPYGTSRRNCDAHGDTVYGFFRWTVN
jgi:hypothetical protein